jgi:ABC-2 type transport system permease protein
VSAEAAAPRAPVSRATAARALFGLCQRDLWVTVRHEPIAFLSQALLQPIFFLFVFGRVLPEMGSARVTYGVQLLPGILALTLFLTALQNTALPLVIEFSFTREIEDRLLAPLPVPLVAIQKMLIASFRAIIAALIILPLGELILPGGIHVANANWAAFAALLILGSLTAAGVGLVMGTAVPPNRISIMFALVLTPLIFSGCTFYPWAGLYRLRWFQILTLFNPLTYVSEGMRVSLTGLPHMNPIYISIGLGVSFIAFTMFGTLGFIRRAID